MAFLSLVRLHPKMETEPYLIYGQADFSLIKVPPIARGFLTGLKSVHKGLGVY